MAWIYLAESVDSLLRSSHGLPRLSWQINNGRIPRGSRYHGTCVLHRCDNPPCVNPEHLFLGSNSDNMKDMHAKGRNNQAKLERHGQAKLTRDAVREIRKSSLSLKKLAVKFGVTDMTIHAAKKGLTWKNI